METIANIDGSILVSETKNTEFCGQNFVGVYMDKLPRRRNIRLKDYDYSQAGYYFITICTKDMKNIFWNVGATWVAR